MKHGEFYRKYRTNYPPMMNPWNFVFIMAVAACLEPLLIYRNFRHTPFTLDFYFNQMEHFSFIGVPLTVFFFWANWREAKKRALGFCWVGKFEVVGKRKSFASFYLALNPGIGNELRVDRALFKKTRVGDFVIVRRDPFGEVDEVRRVNNFLGRISRPKAQVVYKTG